MFLIEPPVPRGEAQMHHGPGVGPGHNQASIMSTPRRMVAGLSPWEGDTDREMTVAAE